jgi:hypothetical protein
MRPDHKGRIATDEKLADRAEVLIKSGVTQADQLREELGLVGNANAWKRVASRLVARGVQLSPGRVPSTLDAQRRKTIRVKAS